MFINKFVLGLMVVCTGCVSSMNAMESGKPNPKTQTSQKQIETSSIIKDDDITKRRHAQIPLILKQYGNCMVITKKIQDDLLGLGYKSIAKPKVKSEADPEKEIPYIFCQNAYDVIIVQLLLNIIKKINSEKKYNSMMPQCICEVKLGNNIIQELFFKISELRLDKVLTNINVYYNADGYIFVDSNEHNFFTYAPLTNASQALAVLGLTDAQLTNTILQIYNDTIENNKNEYDKITQFNKLLNNQIFKQYHCTLLRHNTPMGKIIDTIKKTTELSNNEKLSILKLLHAFYQYQVEHAKLWPLAMGYPVNKDQLSKLESAYKNVVNIVNSVIGQINNTNTHTNNVLNNKQVVKHQDNDEEFEIIDLNTISELQNNNVHNKQEINNSKEIDNNDNLDDSFEEIGF